jgi:hypothetical protein
MLFAMALTNAAMAIGVAENGAYKVWGGERTPADVFENVRIVPPPTGGPLKVSVRTDRARYHVGDPLRITFGVNRDAYVYIFDTDAAGLTHQIFPNYYDTSNFIRAGKTYYIPDRGYDIEITPPSGNDTLSIVATERDWPFFEEYRRYSSHDPFPSSREGATDMVRRIEHFRTEPSAMSMQVLRPAPRENLWATDSITYYVMDRYRVPSPEYKVPRYGWLEVDTYPSNSRIYVDTDYYGRSPQVIERLDIGYHHVRLEKEGYLPYDCNVYIKGNETKHLDIFLKETPIEPGYSRSQNLGAGQGFGFFQSAN